MNGHRLFALLAAAAGFMPTAALPRDLRDRDMPAPPAPRAYGHTGTFTSRGGGRGPSDGQHKLLIAAMRMMPTYGCSADRNAAKRTRRARRLAGVHS